MIKIKSKSVSANTIWLLAQQIYSMVLSLIVGAVSARFLGPQNYGVINYGASIITIVSTIAKLGLDSVVVKRLTDSPDNEDSIIGSTLFIRSVCSLLLFFSINIVVFFAHGDEPILRIVILLQSVAMVFNTYEVFTYSFQSKQEYSYICIAAMIAATIANAWKIILVIKHAPVVLFATPTIIQSLVAFIIIVIAYKSKYAIKLCNNTEEGRRLLKSSYHLLLSAIAVTIYTQIDKIMIKAFLDDKSVGLYSAATVLAMIWEFIPQAIINAYRPVIYKNASAQEAFDETISKILAIIVCLSGFVIVGYYVFGKLMIHIVYGEEYASAINALKIISLSTGFAMISTLRGVWMVAKGVEKFDKYCVIIGASVNFVLNIIIIPRFGLIGAAFTTLIAQLVNGILGTLVFKKTRRYLLYLTSLPKYIYLFLTKKKHQ